MHTAADAHMVPARQAPEAVQAGSCGQDLPVHPFFVGRKGGEENIFSKLLSKSPVSITVIGEGQNSEHGAP